MGKNPGRRYVRSVQKRRVGEGSTFKGPGSIARFLALIRQHSITKRLFSVRNPNRK